MEFGSTFAQAEGETRLTETRHKCAFADCDRLAQAESHICVRCKHTRLAAVASRWCAVPGCHLERLNLATYWDRKRKFFFYHSPSGMLCEECEYDSGWRETEHFGLVREYATNKSIRRPPLSALPSACPECGKPSPYPSNIMCPVCDAIHLHRREATTAWLKGATP